MESRIDHSHGSVGRVGHARFHKGVVNFLGKFSAMPYSAVKVSV